jgi:hypothetical protein
MKHKTWSRKAGPATFGSSPEALQVWFDVASRHRGEAWWREAPRGWEYTLRLYAVDAPGSAPVVETFSEEYGTSLDARAAAFAKFCNHAALLERQQQKWKKPQEVDAWSEHGRAFSAKVWYDGIWWRWSVTLAFPGSYLDPVTIPPTPPKLGSRQRAEAEAHSSLEEWRKHWIQLEAQGVVITAPAQKEGHNG